MSKFYVSRQTKNLTIKEQSMKGFKIFAKGPTRRRIAGLSALTLAVSLGVTLAPAHAASIQMTFLTPSYLPADVANIERIVGNWNKANPTTTVKIVYGDPNNINDQLTTAFAGNVAPDIFQSEAASLLSFSKQGYVSDITKDMKPLQSDIPAGLWQTGSFHGRLYGVPTMTQTYTIFANVDLFKKAGVPIPVGSGTLSWDDFRALAKKLTTPTQYAVGWGLKSPAATFMIMATNFGGVYFRGLTTGGGPKIDVTNKELAVPDRVHQMIFDDKTIDPASTLISGGANEAPFLAGKYPMIVGGSFVASDLDVAAQAAGFHWTALPLLKGTVTDAQGANPQTYSISSQSNYKKPAAAFIRYLMQPQNLADLSLGQALIPATNSAAKAALAIKKDSAGWTQILNDSGALTLAPFTLVANYQRWKDTVAQPTFQKWVQGKITRPAMIKALTDGWNSLQ